MIRGVGGDVTNRGILQIGGHRQNDSFNSI